MYIPKHYLVSDQNEVVAFMKQFGFATIVTAQDNFPTATHLPFVVIQDGSEITLVSHFAKANSQWKEIIENKCLVIFSEPHAYISPTHYEKELNVPTWNYLAVHAYGKATIITDTDQSFELLETMIDTYEAEYKNQWNRLPMDYKQRMANGIVPFKIKVEDIQAKQKLSQNKTLTEQQQIINAFSESNNENQKLIASYMKKNITKSELNR